MSSLQGALCNPWFTYALLWTTELARKQITGEGHVPFLLHVSPLVHNYIFKLREPQPSSGCKSFHVFWNCWGNAPRILNRKGFSAFLLENIAVRDVEGGRVLWVESRGWNRNHIAQASLYSWENWGPGKWSILPRLPGQTAATPGLEPKLPNSQFKAVTASPFLSLPTNLPWKLRDRI